MEFEIGKRVDLSGAESKFGKIGTIEKLRGSIAFVKIDSVEKLVPVQIKFLKLLKDEVKITKVMQVVENLPSANKYLISPLTPKEKVIILGFHDDPNFLKVKHNHGKDISIFHKRHFENIKKVS